MFCTFAEMIGADCAETVAWTGKITALTPMIAATPNALILRRFIVFFFISRHPPSLFISVFCHTHG
ncbi:hypothetical protein JCM16418A_17340 [Paenibacillus pini]